MILLADPAGVIVGAGGTSRENLPTELAESLNWVELSDAENAVLGRLQTQQTVVLGSMATQALSLVDIVLFGSTASAGAIDLALQTMGYVSTDHTPIQPSIEVLSLLALFT